MLWRRGVHFWWMDCECYFRNNKRVWRAQLIIVAERTIIRAKLRRLKTLQLKWAMIPIECLIRMSTRILINWIIHWMMDNNRILIDSSLRRMPKRRVTNHELRLCLVRSYLLRRQVIAQVIMIWSDVLWWEVIIRSKWLVTYLDFDWRRQIRVMRWVFEWRVQLRNTITTPSTRPLPFPSHLFHVPIIPCHHILPTSLIYTHTFLDNHHLAIRLFLQVRQRTQWRWQSRIIRIRHISFRSLEIISLLWVRLLRWWLLMMWG